MSVPLITISTFRVREGKLEDLKRYYAKISEIVKANEPQIIAFYGFLNQDSTQMTSIQVHPDTASMDFHMQVLRENWDESFSHYSQMVESLKVEYYGVPPESALNMNMPGSIDLQVDSNPIGGFIRTKTG